MWCTCSRREKRQKQTKNFSSPLLNQVALQVNHTFRQLGKIDLFNTIGFIVWCEVNLTLNVESVDVISPSPPLNLYLLRFAVFHTGLSRFSSKEPWEYHRKKLLKLNKHPLSERTAKYNYCLEPQTKQKTAFNSVVINCRRNWDKVFWEKFFHWRVKQQRKAFCK